ncbi:hypothetical protein PUN28_018512 [Cardiocondyla obscurior]|uniref:Uncharacterized protein n=1 Tax=Cardiocondyla obscurior TaxID=286306 RepID=A0AAW2EI27_9HYME
MTRDDRAGFATGRADRLSGRESCGRNVSYLAADGLLKEVRRRRKQERSEKETRSGTRREIRQNCAFDSEQRCAAMFVRVHPKYSNCRRRRECGSTR